MGIYAYLNISRRTENVIMIQLHENTRYPNGNPQANSIYLLIYYFLTCYIMIMIMLDGILDLVIEFMTSRKINIIMTI